LLHLQKHPLEFVVGVPWPEQCSGQVSVMQSLPVQPGEHTHLPFTHCKSNRQEIESGFLQKKSNTTHIQHPIRTNRAMSVAMSRACVLIAGSSFPTFAADTNTLYAFSIACAASS
jgi:hypothetical protein